MSHTKDEAKKPWLSVHMETVEQSFPKAPFFSALKIWIKSQTKANKKLSFFLKKKYSAWGTRRLPPAAGGAAFSRVGCPEDTAHGRWPLICHHEAGLSVPYRIGISGRRADSPLSAGRFAVHPRGRATVLGGHVSAE